MSRFYALTIVVLLLFTSLPVSAQNDYSFIAKDIYDVEEVIPDPFLASDGNMTFEKHDNINELSVSYEQSEDQSGVVILNWTHIAGTKLEYDNDSYRPREYVYFAQNISWDHTVIPASLNISVNYQIETTGNFSDQSPMRYFNLEAWAIDSSGEWDALTRFYGVPEQYETKSVREANKYVMERLFGPFILGEPIQLQFAIALAPSSSFVIDQNAPWKTYNGSIIVRVKEVHLHATFNEVDNWPSVEPPINNSTYRISESERLVDSSITPDGGVYVLSYLESNSDPSGFVLRRINPMTQTEWLVKWDASSPIYWRYVGGTDLYVYLVGTNKTSKASSVVVSALNYDGSSAYNWSYSISNDIVTTIDVGSDGSVYLGLYKWISDGRSRLVKIGPDGSVQWELNGDSDGATVLIELEGDSQGNIIGLSADRLSKIDADGNIKWEIFNEFGGYEYNLHIMDDDSILLVSNTYSETTIVKVYSNGTIGWEYTNRITYADSWNEYSYVPDIAHSGDGRIFVLCNNYGYHRAGIVIVLSSSGNQLYNFTVAFEKVIYAPFEVPSYQNIHLDNNGILYLVGRTIDPDSYYEVVIATYGTEPTFLGVSMTYLGTVGIALVSVIVVIAIIHFRRKTG